MRWKIASLSLAAALLACGCNLFPGVFKQTGNEKIAPAQKPTPGDLISYLNRSSDKIGAVKVDDLEMVAGRRILKMGLNGKLVCQKPRNFRLEAYGPSGSLEADVGSNSTEFWFYFAHNQQPYLFHCRHDELHKAPPNFPFHPDWMLEALGMGYIKSTDNYRVEMNPRGDTIDLIEDARSPQGQRMTKVTVFNRHNPLGTEVVARKLYDDRGKPIATATIREMRQDQRTGLPVPYRIEFEYHPDDLRLSMTLDGTTVNDTIDAGYAQMKFTRPNMAGVQPFDLARAVDSSYPRNDLRPAGARFRGFQK